MAIACARGRPLVMRSEPVTWVTDVAAVSETVTLPRSSLPAAIAVRWLPSSGWIRIRMASPAVVAETVVPEPGLDTVTLALRPSRP